MTTSPKILTLFFFLLMCIIYIFYYLFLSPLILSYKKSDARLSKTRIALMQCVNNHQKNIHFARTFQKWTLHHPGLYAAQKHPLSQNAFLQYVINAAEQSAFTVVAAAPLVSQQQSHLLSVQLSVHGNYRSLFFFIQQLTTSPYPVIVTNITTNTVNLYQMTVILDERDA